MTRHVFPSAMVAHVWANQSQDNARNAKQSVSFQGPKYYSYRTCVAMFTDANLNGKRVVLISNNHWGNATGRHISRAQAALDKETNKIFYVHQADLDRPEAHSLNVNTLFNAYKERALRFTKPNVHTWGYEDTLDNRLRAIYQAAADYRTYCQIFGLEEPYPNFDYYTYLARTNFAKYYDPRHVSQRNAKAAKEHLRVATIMGYVHAYAEGVWPRKPNITRLPKRMQREAYSVLNPWQPRKSSLTAEQWLAGEGRASALGYHQDKTLVRRKDDRLETSQGAQVPWLDAVRVFGAAQQHRRMDREWHRNGSQYRVGHFQLDRIEADGTIKAGCHVISYDEMLRLAIQEIPYCVLPTYPLPVPVRNHDAQLLSAVERAIT